MPKEEFNKVLSTNGLAAVDLLQKFYQKMDNGHIINIGSLATTQNGYQVKDMEDTSYILSKKLLHNASYFLQEMHTKPIRVTSLELVVVNTSIKNRFHNKEISESEYTEQTLRSIPMKTDDVVNAIDWILNLPKHLEVRNIQLNNFVKPDENENNYICHLNFNFNLDVLKNDLSKHKLSYYSLRDRDTWSDEYKAKWLDKEVNIRHRKTTGFIEDEDTELSRIVNYFKKIK